MAEQQPSAAARPQQAVRRTTTHFGVTHVRAHHSGRYTVIGNHLAQHRQLSLTAIGLAAHILSLPEGAAVDIRSLAERFPEGRDRIAFALRELQTYGYLERVRERTETGRLVTRTYAHHAPGRATAPAAPGRGVHRATSSPAYVVPVPSEPPPSSGPSLSLSPGPSVPPDRPRQPGPTDPSREDALLGRHHDRAVALLGSLRRTDDRLTLSRRDVNRLAPAVTTWFDGGATTAAVHRTLTTDLPPDLRHPAGLVAHRLRELLPPPLPSHRVPSPLAVTATGAVRHVDPFQTCDGCERAFRAPRPGHCRDCRSGPPTTNDPRHAA